MNRSIWAAALVLAGAAGSAWAADADIDRKFGGGAFAAKPAFADDFDGAWDQTQKGWRVATWKQNGTLMATERCVSDGKGFVIQTVLPGEPYRGGSMQTAKEYGYGRWVARVRPSAVPGVLNSVFTKDWDDLTTAGNEHDGSKYEVDIEFLTYTFGPGKGKVHLAIHAEGKPNLFVRDVELDFNPSDDFRVWGFDIFPDRIVWHVDGKVLHTWECPEGESVPPGGHEFFFNSWTSPKWIKGPPTAEARYTIDWVRFYPLTAAPAEPRRP